MPIDLGLLRSDEEGGNLNHVRQWQVLRNGGDTDDKQQLTCIQELNVARRRLLWEIDQKRSTIRALQQSIKDDSSSERETAMSEMKNLKRQVIPDLEQTLQRVSKELDWKLSQVANCVIPLEDIEPPHPPVCIAHPLLKRPQETVVDPLYCLRGYDTLIMPSGRDRVLTGMGAALARSLSNHALHYCRNHSIFSSFTSIILPSCMELESSRAHSIMGRSSSSSDDSLDDSSSTVSVPPWVMASLLHENKKYFDRQLPMGHVIATSTVRDGEPLEAARLDSFGKKSIQKSCTIQGERIELYCLTGNTVSEANAMQREMVNAIVKFHQSLLLVRGVEIQIRVVQPSLLLPCEASRVVIESMLGKSLVTLGYVSNMTDYSTRATKTKIGNNDGYCFAVHGVLCSVPETLEWMLHYNVSEYNNNELGVAVPSPFSLQVQEQLNMSPPTDGVLFMPFSRRIHHGKNGKVKRTELGNASEPCVIQTIKSSHPTEASQQSQRKAFVREGALTAQDIQDERLSCPFGFLPIGR